jgi:hypothetical protein
MCVCGQGHIYMEVLQLLAELIPQPPKPFALSAMTLRGL